MTRGLLFSGHSVNVYDITSVYDISKANPFQFCILFFIVNLAASCYDDLERSNWGKKEMRTEFKWSDGVSGLASSRRHDLQSTAKTHKYTECVIWDVKTPWQ